LDAAKLKVGVVVADFNSDVTHAMLEDARRVLLECRVKPSNIRVAHVYGSLRSLLHASGSSGDIGFTQ